MGIVLFYPSGAAMKKKSCVFNNETYNCVLVDNDLVVWTRGSVSAKDFLGKPVSVGDDTYYVSEVTDPYAEPFISGNHPNKGKVAELRLSEEATTKLTDHNKTAKPTRRSGRAESKRGRVENGVVIR